MASKQTVAPATEPLTAAEVKTYLRIETSDEDTLIGGIIAAARETVENALRRQLVTATWTLVLDEFPPGAEPIELPKPPLQSVSSVAYIDTAGNTQTWASSNYHVDTAGLLPRIAPNNDAVWPSTATNTMNTVTITYVAGYGAAAAVPNILKQAIYLLCGHWLENREAVVVGTIASELPLAVSSIINGFRVPRVE